MDLDGGLVPIRGSASASATLGGTGRLRLLRLMPGLRHDQFPQQLHAFIVGRLFGFEKTALGAPGSMINGAQAATVGELQVRTAIRHPGKADVLPGVVRGVAALGEGFLRSAPYAAAR